MARRFLALAAAACLVAGAAACGGEGEQSAVTAGGDAATAAPEPAGTTDEAPARARGDAGGDRERSRRESRERREPQAPEEGAAPAEEEQERPPRSRAPAERREDGRAKAQADVQRTVREIVGMISAADKRVCRTSFTRRYAEFVSGQRGDAAYRRCESDISQSKGTLEVVDFQETRVDGGRAAVRFRMRVPGTVTRQGWRLVRRGGSWLVDAKL